MPREKEEKRAFQVKGRGFIKAGRLNNVTIWSSKKNDEMDGVKVIRQRVVGNKFGDEYTKEIINVF